MKLRLSQLRRIIKEEVGRVVAEASPRLPSGGTTAPKGMKYKAYHYDDREELPAVMIGFYKTKAEAVAARDAAFAKWIKKEGMTLKDIDPAAMKEAIVTSPESGENFAWSLASDNSYDLNLQDKFETENPDYRHGEEEEASEYSGRGLPKKEIPAMARVVAPFDAAEKFAAKQLGCAPSELEAWTTTKFNLGRWAFEKGAKSIQGPGGTYNFGTWGNKNDPAIAFSESSAEPLYGRDEVATMKDKEAMKRASSSEEVTLFVQHRDDRF